jgi:hypothetical protein
VRVGRSSDANVYSNWSFNSEYVQIDWGIDGRADVSIVGGDSVEKSN